MAQHVVAEDVGTEYLAQFRLIGEIRLLFGAVTCALEAVCRRPCHGVYEIRQHHVYCERPIETRKTGHSSIEYNRIQLWYR